jgi:hypothetical protein
MAVIAGTSQVNVAATVVAVAVGVIKTTMHRVESQTGCGVLRLDWRRGEIFHVAGGQSGGR